MKRALLLAAVDPSIGGILVFGDRGTGKSTAVQGPRRSAAADEGRRRLPLQLRARRCRPLLQSRAGTQLAAGTLKHRADRRCPSSTCRSARPKIVSPARSISKRRWSRAKRPSSPGCWRARIAASSISTRSTCWRTTWSTCCSTSPPPGVNIVEREGLSMRHPARFVLVGSGNPEEGELRPQLLDRFGLSVDVASPKDVPSRVEVVKRRDAFDRDPEAFVAKWKRKDADLRSKITKGAGAPCLDGDAGRNPRVRIDALPRARRRRTARRTDADAYGARAGRPAGQLGADRRSCASHCRLSPAAPAAPRSARRSPIRASESNAPWPKWPRLEQPGFSAFHRLGATRCSPPP